MPTAIVMKYLVIRRPSVLSQGDSRIIGRRQCISPHVLLLEQQPRHSAVYWVPDELEHCVWEIAKL